MDGRSRLESVTGGLAGGLPVGVGWEFDAGDRRSAAAYANGTASAWEYDLANRLTRIQHKQDVGGQLDPFCDVEHGYDAAGNRLWKRDRIKTDRSEVYEYDQRHRLVGFGRGGMAPDEPALTAPSNDPEMPNRQDWLNLDRRGNWIGFESQVREVTASETRTLGLQSGGGDSSGLGGKMNEYERVAVQTALGPPVRQRRDAPGNPL